MPAQNLKRCSICKAEKPATNEFFPRKHDKLYSNCKLCHAKRTGKLHQKLRLEALKYYSGGDPKCSCCGESQLEFLTLDHIDGSGAEERKNVKSGRNTAYLAKKRGYPPGYRVLCMNCNFALGMSGYCPHNPPSTTTVSSAETCLLAS